MANNTTQKQAARQFVQDWSGKGYEKGETARFWIALLQNVYGIQDATKFMEFELPVKTILKEKGADFIDGYIPTTKVLIEQKGSKVDLSAKSRQSDGSELTPYQQARRYAAGLPVSMAPRWIVACNFSTFEVHDMERPNDAPEVIELKDLEKEYHRLSFLVDDSNVHLKKELEVSIQAGEIVGVLYDKILAQYKDPTNPESQKSLNKLCVRIVFCLYAEDAGIFGAKNMFHDYLEQFTAAELREKLIKLFRILDTKPEERDPYEDEKLLAFPYVNGGMFAGDIEIPRFNDEVRTLLLQRASDDFDWSVISPTIFGAVFESTLNPETRRSSGMHYTSIENIHKVIDPLFLDDLKAELADIRATSVAKVKRERALEFQDKISRLKFLDPACGSGNFLTESYTSLRRLENEALRVIYGGDRVIGDMVDPIKVSINQFYGIEINDFACSVAQTALWIAESQMMAATDEIVGFNLDPLPLRTYTNIHEGNALRMDWNEVVPAGELDYIMGNPPFLGARVMSADQKDDLISVFGAKWKNIGNMDYVTGWYQKAIELMNLNSHLSAALVSTSSITQGEQVANLWKPLIEGGINIIFAWRPFKWTNEASAQAEVYCVIVGFSKRTVNSPIIYDNAGTPTLASNVSPYLIDGENVLLDAHQHPLCDVPEIGIGNQPIDGGNYLFTSKEKDEFLQKEPGAEKYFRPWYGTEEFISRQPRWCLWLGDAHPSELLALPECLKRIDAVRNYRLASSRKATLKLADKPTHFQTENIPKGDYLLIPEITPESRSYIAIGFMTPDILCSNLVKLMPGASLYHFGVLTSSIHNAWTRAVAGRLGNGIRYSKDIVYNNYPWPEATQAQIDKIKETARAILDARQKYPDVTYSKFYQKLYLFPELLAAHRANDAAVLEAYGFPKDASESDIVARLFKMYQDLTTNLE